MPSGSFFLADAVKFSPVDIFHEKNGRGSVFPSLPLKPTNCNWKAKISQQACTAKQEKWATSKILTEFSTPALFEIVFEIS